MTGVLYVQLEPRTEQLLRQVLHTLFEQELAPLADSLIARGLFSMRGVLRVERIGYAAVWRMTEFGELALREVLDLATCPGWPPVLRHRAIEDALTLAGYGDRRPT